jgi:hypothetical protein
MRLLESRLPSLESDSRDQADELATFGWWLGSGKFPETGPLNGRCGFWTESGRWDPTLLWSKLSIKLALRRPYEAVRIVRVLFEDDKDGWAVHGWDQHLDS